jgi:DNA modification methylase
VPIGLSDREKYEQKRHSFKSVKTNKSANIDFNVSPILPPEQIIKNSENGRFPSNVIHDGSDDVMQEFNKYGKTKSGATKKDVNAYDGDSNTTLLRGKSNPQNQHGDSGSIARFYYCAKASKRDRTCDGQVENKHPAVKNRNLMSYLAKLTKTPTGGIVLDPFMGSGSTGIGCLMEGRYFIGIEKEKESFGTAKARLEIVANETCATANVHKKEKVPLSSNSQFPAIQMQEIDMFD